MNYKTLFTGCMLVLISFTSNAEQYQLPITPIGEVKLKQSDAVDDRIDDVINQVVNNLPSDKKKELIKHFPANDIAQPNKTVSNSFAPQKDSFGRSTLLYEQTSTEVIPKTTPADIITEQMKKKFKPVQRYKLTAGDNITLPAAKFIMNSIRTNFGQVEVKTTDPNVVLEMDGSFVYFTTEKDAPFGLRIYEKGVPESQVNITVWPLNVLATMVEVDVSLDKATKSKIAKIKRDIKIEQQHTEIRIRDKESELILASDPKFQSSPYEYRINNIFSQIAGNETPKGYNFIEGIPPKAKYPCRFDAKSETKQRLISSRRIVDVVLVQNTHPSRSIVLREEQCWTSGDIISTAILNKATLKPNEMTEVYVMRDRLYYERIKNRNNRPSLLN